MNNETIIGYCGRGRFATDNENSKNGKIELASLKWEEFKDLVDDPQEDADKLNSWWIIFNDAKSRLIKNVTSDTKYYCLWADIDKAHDDKDLEASIRLWTGGCDFEIYSSHSATESNNKSRVVIPLDSGISRDDWIACQLLLNEILISSGIEPDPVTKNPVQICFLPNKGQYYKVVSNRNDVFFNIDVIRDDIVNKKDYKESSGGDRSSSDWAGSGLTHKEIVKKLCTGQDGYHEAQNYYAWGRIKENATRGAVIGELEAFAEMWQEDSERWSSRFNDISRCVDGAISRLNDESKVDVEDLYEAPRIKKRVLPMPPGMLGKLCDNALSMSWHPHNEVALASSLGLVAGIAGRKFNVSNTGLNLYITLVADTAMGKDSINRFINTTLASLNVMGHSSSFIGLSDCTGPKPMARSVQIARSKICVFEEAGLMMASQSGSQAELQKFLLSSYTSSGWNGMCGGKGYSDEKNDIPLIHAMSLSIISESTPDVLHKALKATGALNSGHIPRQTIFRVTGDKPYRNANPKRKIDEQLYERLLKLVNKCCEIQSKDKLNEDDVFHFEFPDDIRQEEYEFSCKCVDLEREFRDTPKGRMAGRAAVKAMKYAAIATVLNYEHQLVIQRPEWEWGRALAQYELDSVDEFFEGSAFVDDIDSLVKQIMAPSILRLLKGGGLDNQAKLTPFEMRMGYIPAMKIFRDNKQKSKLRFDERFTHKECIEKLLRDMVKGGYLYINHSAVNDVNKPYKGDVYMITGDFNALFNYEPV